MPINSLMLLRLHVNFLILPMQVLTLPDFARIPLFAKHGEPVGYNGKVQDLIVIAMGNWAHKN